MRGGREGKGGERERNGGVRGAGCFEFFFFLPPVTNEKVSYFALLDRCMSSRGFCSPLSGVPAAKAGKGCVPPVRGVYIADDTVFPWVGCGSRRDPIFFFFFLRRPGPFLPRQARRDETVTAGTNPNRLTVLITDGTVVMSALFSSMCSFFCL